MLGGMGGTASTSGTLVGGTLTVYVAGQVREGSNAYDLTGSFTGTRPCGTRPDRGVADILLRRPRAAWPPRCAGGERGGPLTSADQDGQASLTSVGGHLAARGWDVWSPG